MKTHQCCDHSLSTQQAKEMLAQHGISRTQIKTKILLILSQDSKPLSAQEIHQEIGPQNCDISSIWRSLKQFQEKGLTREINLGEEFFRYQLKDPNHEDDHHHHHIRCRQCGDIQQLAECNLNVFDKMVSKLGYQDTEHYLEFTGICADCSQR